MIWNVANTTSQLSAMDVSLINVFFDVHYFDLKPFFIMILISTVLAKSNLSFFFFPVHFFCQGIRARILETFVMLFLLALLILGIVWVASALIDNDAASMESLYGKFLKDFMSFMLVNLLLYL